MSIKQQIEEWKEDRADPQVWPLSTTPRKYDQAMQALEEFEEAIRVAIDPLELFQKRLKELGRKDISILAESLKNAFKGVLKKHGF